MTPHPNILARNWAKVSHVLNIYGSAKRSVFYIIHCCHHKLLQERSFCTIVLYYWLLICMLNPALLKCIYCYLTSCILCGFDLNRLDKWIFLGCKNYANQCPAALGTRVFFSRVQRGASFRRPQADTCRAGHLTEIGNRAWKASATQSNVLLKVLLRSNLGICFWLHISSSRLTLRICGTQQYQCRLPSKVSKVQIRLTFAAWNKLLFRDLYNNAKF